MPYINQFSDPMADPLVSRLSYDLNEAKEIIKDKQMTIEQLEEENRTYKDRCEKLLKANMEMTDRYLSIIDRLKEI